MLSLLRYGEGRRGMIARLFVGRLMCQHEWVGAEVDIRFCEEGRCEWSR
jgi:hypothetical protein